MSADSQSKDDLKKQVHKDVIGSALLGPVRVMIPIVGYLILFPFISEHAGLAVLGIWFQLRSLYDLISMGDVGFSALLSREAGRDRPEEELRGVRKDFAAAMRFYIAILIVLCLFIFAFGSYLVGELLNWSQHYDRTALVISIFVFVAAAILQMCSLLYSAILTARSDAAYVHAVAGFTPLFPLFGTAIGVAIGYTLEGFAIGALIGSMVRTGVFRSRVMRKHKDWTSIPGHLPLNETWSHVVDFMRRSWKFYSISMAHILREPVFRFTMGGLLGAETVGIYAIAFQVVVSIRTLLTAGFNTLLPGLAVFHRTEQRAEAMRLIRVSEVMLIAAGSLLYGGFMLGADYIYAFWLKPQNVPVGLGELTFYLSFWFMITLHNVPYFRYMQACGYEGTIAACIWIHTISVLFLIPLGSMTSLTLEGMMIWWVGFGVLTQVFLYAMAERRLSCVIETVKHPSLLVLIPSLWVFLFASLALTATQGTFAPRPSVEIDWQRMGYAALILGGYSLIVAWVLFPYGKDLLARFQTRRQKSA